MKRLYGKLYKFIIVATIIVISLLAILGNTETYSPVYAATYVGENDFDSTAVLDDLQSNDSTFDVTDYAFNEKQGTQIIAFNEYCYSYYSNQRGNYALYVYIWNPQGLDINTSSTKNNIKIRFGSNTGASFNTQRLYFCNCSTGDYQGLFYKFKVYLSSDDKETVFDTLNSVSRVYEVSEIELVTNGSSATAYYVSTIYTFTGYAAGYGANNTSTSTLTCMTEQADTLSLDVESTFYRPDGNSTDAYTQDSLHSVYFSVPNEYLTNYGYMSAVHATWRDAVLNPALVTGNSTAAAAINSYLGVDIGEGIDDLAYGYAVNLQRAYTYYADYAYNFYTIGTYGVVSSVDEYISTLYMLFEVSDADTAYIDGDTIKAKMLSMTEKYGGDLVNGAYSSCLFESVADTVTEVNIQADNEYTLMSATYSQSFWQKYFTGGFTQNDSTTFNSIKAIYAVSDSDFSGTATENAARLYINENDYDDFKTYYDNAVANDETVYLFRYQVSDYWAAEASCMHKYTNFYGNPEWEEVDTNARFFKETVNLDFDIIDVTFSNGETNTVIGVVMSPIDIVSGSTSAVNTTDDDDSWKDKLKMILAIIALVLVVILLFPVLPYIAKFIVWIIALPFKLIKTIVQAFKKSDKNKKE